MQPPGQGFSIFIWEYMCVCVWMEVSLRMLYRWCKTFPLQNAEMTRWKWYLSWCQSPDGCQSPTIPHQTLAMGVGAHMSHGALGRKDWRDAFGMSLTRWHGKYVCQVVVDAANAFSFCSLSFFVPGTSLGTKSVLEYMTLRSGSSRNINLRISYHILIKKETILLLLTSHTRYREEISGVSGII